MAFAREANAPGKQHYEKNCQHNANEYPNELRFGPSLAVWIGAIAKSPDKTHDEADKRDRQNEIHQEKLAGCQWLVVHGLHHNRC